MVPDADRPWNPANLSVSGIYKRTREVLVSDERSGRTERRNRVVWDVRFRVDGRQFRYGFEQKGWAEEFVTSLHQGFARGWLFDPRSRRFLAPTQDGGEAITFYRHVEEYIGRQWRRWQPATRRNAQRDLARACIFLVDKDAPRLSADERLELDRYLREVALMVPAPAEVPDDLKRWEAWIADWSLPLTAITDQHLHAFLEEVRFAALDGTRRDLAASSFRRTRAVVRGAFSNALKRRRIEWDPWEAVEAEPVRDHEHVDVELVMDSDQVRAIARACGEMDPRYEAFVLIQGFCGLRPGEAVELRRRDLVFEDGRLTSVTVRATHSAVPARFFASGETAKRPLKGRGMKAVRTIRVPAELAAVLERHLRDFVPEDNDALVFPNTRGTQIDLSNFHRDVWKKARNIVFDENDPLRRVRRHDLRHSAVTAWLNAGVPLKTAQNWSGHRTVSVLLNTYLGVIKGDDDLALARFEAALEPAKSACSDDTLVTQQTEKEG